ncbi:MAG: hypothetical protein GY906_23965 [bacterium]|nr:hypothetical protein [bacterium]
MNLLKILLLLRSLPIGDLLKFPKDLKNSEEVGSWLGTVLDALDVLSDLTDTEIDDKIVDSIAAVLNDDEAWKSIHSIFVVLFLAKDDVVNVECPAAVTRVANKAGFNPLIIISIVQAVIAFLRLFKTEEN